MLCLLYTSMCLVYVLLECFVSHACVLKSIGDDENVFTEPPSNSTEISYGIFSCFGSGSISLSVRIDKGAYKCGESMLITAEVNNQSNKTIRAIRANIRHVWIMARSTFKKSFKAVTDHNVHGSKSINWNYNLEVPHYVESYESNGCKLSYFLQVTVIVSYAKNVLVELPFEILPRENKPSPYAGYGGGRSGTTQPHTTSTPWSAPATKPYPTVARPEAYTSWRHNSPPSCRYRRSSSCSY